MAKQFRHLPALPGVRPAGWAALADRFDIQAPVRNPTCVAESFIRGGHRIDSGWHIFDKRYWPGDTAADHLEFALRHETLDLVVLKRALQATDPAELVALLQVKPTGIYSRRLWYFYEVLTGQRLNRDDAPTNPAIDLIDPNLYFTGKPQLSKRHRVRDNLLGTPQFCPVIRRTKTLEAFLAVDLAAKARDIVNRAGPHLTYVAAITLADDGTRSRRWQRILPEAGKVPLTVAEILLVQSFLLGDEPLAKPGFSSPELANLVADLLAANNRMQSSKLDPALQAAATGFGFAYLHPLENANDRLHRYLIHHILVERKFTPEGALIPVANVMFDKFEDYKVVLRNHTGPLQPFLSPSDGSSPDLTDFYRYFDCTEAAEFLCACITRAIRQDLPREIDYRRRLAEAMRQLDEKIEMPTNTAELLILLTYQNQGKLSSEQREKRFAFLNDSHVATVEAIVNEAFNKPQS